VLTAKAFAQETTLAHDGPTLHIREVEDWVTMAEQEHSVALASTHVDVEGLAWRIALLEGELAKECRS
jgi:hypothetical protein